MNNVNTSKSKKTVHTFRPSDFVSRSKPLSSSTTTSAPSKNQWNIQRTHLNLVKTNRNNPFIINMNDNMNENMESNSTTNTVPSKHKNDYNRKDSALLNDPAAFWKVWSEQRQQAHNEDCNFSNTDSSNNPAADSKLIRQMKGCNCFEGLGSIM